MLFVIGQLYQLEVELIKYVFRQIQLSASTDRVGEGRLQRSGRDHHSSGGGGLADHQRPATAAGRRCYYCTLHRLGADGAGARVCCGFRAPQLPELYSSQWWCSRTHDITIDTRSMARYTLNCTKQTLVQYTLRSTTHAPQHDTRSAVRYKLRDTIYAPRYDTRSAYDIRSAARYALRSRYDTRSAVQNTLGSTIRAPQYDTRSAVRQTLRSRYDTRSTAPTTPPAAAAGMGNQCRYPPKEG